METATVEKPKKRRPKGTGSIFHPKYKDRHGTLRECRNFWIQYYRNGRICRENTSSPVKKVAEGLLKKRLGQIEMGQSFAPKVEQILFDELADDLRAEYRKEENRIDRLEQSLAKLQVHFGGIRMAGIGTTLLNGYIVLRQCRPDDEGAHPKLSTGASNATINRELAALKRMFYYGMEQEPPKVLRVPTIKMLPESDARQGVVSNDQYQALIRELPGYLRAFIATLYLTGMRFREALWLRWSEIDWLNRTLHLPRRRTKNKSGKVVKFDDELYQWLNMQRQIRVAKFPECEWVFFGKTGKQIRNPYGAFRTACRRAGIFVKDHELTRPPTFHDFRRTFATEMRRAGVAEGVIMDMAGWKTRSIFERYFIKDESDQQEALRKRKEAAISTSLNKDERSQAVPQQSVIVESTN